MPILIKAEFTEVLANIVESGLNIFNFEYTLYDPLHKPELEEKFIKRYYFSEIGYETVGRFIHRLETHMKEILPKYNKMYEAIAVSLDPYQQKKSTTVIDRDTVEDMDATNTVILDQDDSNSIVVDEDTTNDVTTIVDSDSTATEDNQQRFDDSPQSRVDLSSAEFLTEMTEEDNVTTTAIDSTTSSDVIGTRDSTTTEVLQRDSTQTTTGAEDKTTTVDETVTISESDRTQADLLEEFKLKYDDIDVLIIEELGVLFMDIYG